VTGGVSRRESRTRARVRLALAPSVPELENAERTIAEELVVDVEVDRVVA
jgi:hypothetical protein